MTIDELVTIIRFEIENSGLNKLQSLGKLTEKTGKSAEGMGRGFESAEKQLGGTTKATDRLAASFQRVALAATSALSAGAAMRFALHSADEAKQLNDLSAGLDVSSGELKLWGSAMKMAGRDADAFYANLAGLRKNFGSYSLDEVMADADYLKKVKDAHGMPAAINEADAMGWSEDSAHWLMQGSDAIQKSLDELRRNGYEVTKEQIENSSALSKAYSALAESLSITGNKIVADFAPGLTGALTAINDGLTENQSSIDAWATNAGIQFQGFVDAAIGKLGMAEDAIARFNNKLVSENASSPDPAVRKKNIDELEERLEGQAEAIGLEALGYLLPHYNPETGFRLPKPITAIRNFFKNKNMEKAGEPLYQAAQKDAELTLGDNFSDTDDPLKDWFANYRAYRKLPGGALEKPIAPEMLDSLNFPPPALERESEITWDAMKPLRDLERQAAALMPEIKFPGLLYKSDLDMMDINRAEVLDSFNHVFLPPERVTPPAATPGAMGGGMGSGDVTIQRQEINININGTGLDGQTIARMTAAEIRAAARNADFAPRRR